MKMFEAIEVARKTGKKIRRGKDHAVWFDDKLIWEDIRTYVMVSNVNLDADWEVVEPPPKEYDFTEAYRMMKEGKWMRPVGNTLEHACLSGEWRCRNSSSHCTSCNPYLCWKHIDSKWIEVNP